MGTVLLTHFESLGTFQFDSLVAPRMINILDKILKDAGTYCSGTKKCRSIESRASLFICRIWQLSASVMRRGNIVKNMTFGA